MICETLEDLIRLHKKETEWIEFKVNNEEPHIVGEYISALANSAVLHNVQKAYLVYGIEDSTLKIVGTDFQPKIAKKGNEELENWLHRLLEPSIDFTIYEFECDDKSISVFEIDCATHRPVSFNGREYIRVGSYKKPLKDYPEKERKLWQKFSAFCFEDEIAKSHLTIPEVVSLLNCKSFFELLNLPYNETASTDEYIISKFLEYELITNDNSSLNITNLGALLFANNLNDFNTLVRKKIRVIKYKNNSKLNTEFEQEGVKGYAVGFQGLIKYIMQTLPRNEAIKDALRKEVSLYPEIAIRELIANALIHQDLTIRGTNPMIEIYDNRIEITNNGKPLIDVLRLIDYQPKSRNEKLANLMRMMGICEERGSGIDKVIDSIEVYQLPAPKFIAESDYFKVVLFAPLAFKDMDKQDRIRATYQHCCLKFMNQEFMTNSTLRKRFGLSDKQHSKASKIISDTLEVGLIKPSDPENRSTKHIKYMPFFG
jgi:ATP-dependent DNA helicase RecG